MSAIDPARPQSSRRTLLTAAAAGLLAGGATFAVKAASPAAAGVEVDRLFRRWLDLQVEMATTSDHTDEWIEEMDAKAIAIERQIRGGPQSIMRAGALCLFGLRYGITWMSTEPRELDHETPADEDANLAVAVLPVLMPGLTGTVREIAADFLDHPAREVRHCRLWGAQSRGEA